MGGLLKEEGPGRSPWGCPFCGAQSPTPCAGVPAPISLVPARRAAVHANTQPASSLPHPGEVSSRAQAHLDFLEHRTVALPGQWEGGCISSPWRHLMGGTHRTITWPTQEKMGPCRPPDHGQMSSLWLFKNRGLPPVPRAYQLRQSLQILVPNYSILCLLSDFLLPDQPGSKGWGARSRDPYLPPSGRQEHKIPGWNSRWNRSSSRCSSKNWNVLRQ